MAWLLWLEKREFAQKELATKANKLALNYKSCPQKLAGLFDLVFLWVNRIQGHEYKLLLT